MSNATTKPILQLENVHSYYGNIHALHGISLYVNQGEVVTLIGANGAGKSTTIRTISGIMHPREGTVIFEGQPIQGVPAHELVGRGIAQSPEGRRIFPRLSVQDNLLMGAYLRNDKKEIQADTERVFQLFPRLKERRIQLGGTLSGGEQQMLAIGRAMMARPRLLLLDEPSMGLAPVLVEGIFEIVKQINAQGTTILLVEQNALMALEVASRGYVLQSGSVVLTDEASALLKNEMIRKVYLGEN
ncbi:MAG: ABC transporter ATP-binding protein [Chloroflexota bacterium]